MPRATLVFDTADIDDEHALEVALAAPKILVAVQAFDECLRRAIHDNMLDGVVLQDGAADILARARALLLEELTDRGVAHLTQV